MARQGAEPAAPAARAAPLGWPPLDWDRPWFQPFAVPGQRVLQRIAQGLPLHQALDAEGSAPVRFVPQQALPAGAAYERHIFETGQCPTRPGLHDFFNGLCWMRLPRAKQRLNALQAGAIAGAPVGAPRGALRDAITVFDENGALLDAPAPLWAALRARDWQRLFVDLRPLWAQARLQVFGHALLEKLVTPRKALTAHVWDAACVLPATGALAQADAWLAGEFLPARLAAKPFLPIPVLGIPGWWGGNQDFSFYDDPRVFRARRPQPPP